MNIKTIYQKIDKTAEQYGMLSSGDTVVAAVSGGADSMLLLHYLMACRRDCRLTVAHVEHGIRGEASLRDCAFVEQFCREHRLEFHCLHLRAPEEAKACGMGVEEYARRRRYAFFDSIEADKIATAHHMSDNTETFLFRLSRGMSGRGACGIPPVRGRIIRPLLACTAEEIRAACDTAGIPYVTDETNACTDYTRNYIRHEIVPAFKKLNPQFDAAVSRYIASVTEQDAFLEQCAQKVYEDCFHDGALELERFCEVAPAVAKRVLMRLYPFDEAHLSQAYCLVQKPGRCQLNGNCYAVADARRLRIACFSDDVPEFTVVQQRVSYDDYLANREHYRKAFAFCCDGDKIRGNISVRSRQEGDSIRPAGRGCTKSLKKLFNELKIPLENRQRIPVLCDADGVIGVYGYTPDERVNISEQTETVCLLSIHTEDKFA